MMNQNLCSEFVFDSNYSRNSYVHWFVQGRIPTLLLLTAMLFICLLNMIACSGYSRASHGPVSTATVQTVQSSQEAELSGLLNEFSQTKHRATERVRQEVYFDSPYAMSVEKFAYLSAPPSLKGVADYLRSDLQRRHADNHSIQFDVLRETDQHLRILISSIRREVISDRDYWEMVFLDIFLASSGKENAIEKAIETATVGSSSMAATDSDLASAIREPRELFDLTILTSGRFAAGGKPASPRDYAGNLETDFFEGLDLYTTLVLNRVSRYLRSQVEMRYDARTGKAVGKPQ